MTRFVENGKVYDPSADELVWTSGRRAHCDDYGYLNDEQVSYFKTEKGAYYLVIDKFKPDTFWKNMLVCGSGSDRSNWHTQVFGNVYEAAESIGWRSGMGHEAACRMLGIQLERG